MGLVEEIEHLKELTKKKQDAAEVASNRNNDEGLSITIISLARVNSGLSQKGAYAKYVARNAQRVVESLKEERDIRRAERTLELAQTQAVGKSEAQAKAEVYREYTDKIEEAFKIYTEAQLIADQADALGFRTDTYLKMAQTRVSLMKADKK